MTATVKGYVQGVGFRRFVQRVATRSGLRGYVRNMPEGTVHLIASGDRAALDNLLQALWHGPAGAHVTAVETDFREGDTAGLPEPFEVRP